ncbi:MAG: Uma2 family endonuclease [Actinomycetota bacterium]|nr:Uma2 family endonuclease [Actinomycetota bacterium]
MSATLPWGARLQIADLAGVPEDGHRYELIDGSLLVTPAPSPLHQIVVLRLAQLLDAAIGEDLVVLPAPVNFVISEYDVPQPDSIVARRSDLSERGVEGHAQLVAEVLSPGTRPHDRGAKRLLYESARVPGFWLVDPSVPSFEALELREDHYVEIGRVEGDETLRDPVFGVEITPLALLR